MVRADTLYHVDRLVIILVQTLSQITLKYWQINRGSRLQVAIMPNRIKDLQHDKSSKTPFCPSNHDDIITSVSPIQQHFVRLTRITSFSYKVIAITKIVRWFFELF